VVPNDIVVPKELEISRSAFMMLANAFLVISILSIGAVGSTTTWRRLPVGTATTATTDTTKFVARSSACSNPAADATAAGSAVFADSRTADFAVSSPLRTAASWRHFPLNFGCTRQDAHAALAGLKSEPAQTTAAA
jgi:hypothetical protein